MESINDIYSVDIDRYSKKAKDAIDGVEYKKLKIKKDLSREADRILKLKKDVLNIGLEILSEDKQT